MRTLLETDRLVLREFAAADADHLFALDADPEVTRHTGGRPADDVGWYRDRIRTVYRPYYAHPWHGYWAAVDRAGGRFLGWFHLRPALDFPFAAAAGYRPGDVDLGYRFRREAWGRGLATEGAAALVGTALTDPAAVRVVACAAEANRASVRVLEKVGLVRAGSAVLPAHTEPVLTFARPNPLSAPVTPPG